MAAAERGASPAERTGRGKKSGAVDTAGLFARELWDPHVYGKHWLQAMSLAMDAWLRSGAFLEFMQQGIEAAVAVQRLQKYGPTASPGEPSVGAGAEPPDFHSGKKE